MFQGVDRGFKVARTIEAVAWEKSDSYHEPELRYEGSLELGDLLFPLMADSEIKS